MFQTDGVFIFIGHTPNTRMFEGQVEMENGYIKVDDHMKTNIPGVYAAGEAAELTFPPGCHFRRDGCGGGDRSDPFPRAGSWLKV